MKRKNLSLLFLVGLLLPVTTLTLTPLVDSQATPDFTITVRSSLKGNFTFSATEFLALPNVTGWANGGDYGLGKYTGVNVTWLLVTYGDYGANLSFKFTASDGFTATKSQDQLLSNATHCHILAYYYDDAILPDNNHLCQLMPISLNEATPISYIGNQNPWGIRYVDVIGQSEAAQSDLNVLIFLIIFSSGVFLGTLGIVSVSIYMTKRKEAKA